MSTVSSCSNWSFSENCCFWVRMYFDDIVVLMTLWWWPFYDVGDRIIMLIAFFHVGEFLSVKNRSPTSKIGHHDHNVVTNIHHQHPSPIFVTNIDVALYEPFFMTWLSSVTNHVTLWKLFLNIIVDVYILFKNRFRLCFNDSQRHRHKYRDFG